jgi:Pirin C-terminal cupin domain
VFRFNFCHGSHEDRQRRYDIVREIEKRSRPPDSQCSPICKVRNCVLAILLRARMNLPTGGAFRLDMDPNPGDDKARRHASPRSLRCGDRFEGPRLLIFRPGDRIIVKAMRSSRMMFLGGAALEGPRYIWWNFVSSRKERIEQAKDDWRTGRFKTVLDETEFIPLPEL